MKCEISITLLSSFTHCSTTYSLFTHYLYPLCFYSVSIYINNVSLFRGDKQNRFRQHSFMLSRSLGLGSPRQSNSYSLIYSQIYTIHLLFSVYLFLFVFNYLFLLLLIYLFLLLIYLLLWLSNYKLDNTLEMRLIAYICTYTIL